VSPVFDCDEAGNIGSFPSSNDARLASMLARVNTLPLLIIGEPLPSLPTASFNAGGRVLRAATALPLAPVPVLVGAGLLGARRCSLVAGCEFMACTRLENCK